MNTWIKGSLSAAVTVALAAFSGAANRNAADASAPPATPIYVSINQDISFPTPNTINFYTASATQLTLANEVSTGGFGISGGFFGTPRINSVPSLTAPCLYVSDAGSNDIASISMPSQAQVGTFSGSKTDSGSDNGIGLAVNATYLYAGYSTSNTIGAFALQNGCGLTFLGDVPAAGLQGGSISGMAVNANILVVAYGDGSIQSFNVASGLPVSNNDLRNSTGNINDPNNMPSGVDLTQDGHYAVFGDIAFSPKIEVATISTKGLSKTVVYTAGAGVSAGNIRLSPDETLLYIANSEGGTVTAAFFNKTTGKVTAGCTSPTLSGFNGRPWFGNVATRDTTGTGNVLYVGEFGRAFLEVNHGPPSAIGILTVTSNGSTCTLSEASSSPIVTAFPGALSVGVYPPRPF